MLSFVRLALCGMSFCIGALLCVIPVEAAGSVTVQPERLILTQEQGEVQHASLQISTVLPEEIVVRVRTLTVLGADEYGAWRTIDTVSADRWNVARWLEYPESTTISGAESFDIPVTVRVPADTPSGGYVAVLAMSVFSKQRELLQRIDLPVVVTVGNDMMIDWNITQFDIDGDALQEGNPVRFRLQIENQGATPLLPRGKIFLQHDGTPVYEVREYRNAAGEYEYLSYLEINPTMGYVLPGQRRTFIIPWDRSMFTGVVEANYEVTVEEDPETVLQGNAMLSLQKDIRVDRITYDYREGVFVVVLRNAGNIQMPLRGQMSLYNALYAEPIEVLRFPDEMQSLTYIEVGEHKEIRIPSRFVRNADYAVFAYVIDETSGETLTARIALQSSPMVTTMSVLPTEFLYIVIVILVGILLWVRRRAK